VPPRTLGQTLWNQLAVTGKVETRGRVLRDPDLFRECRPQALEAAEVVGRIRADEEIHVASLHLYLGDLRHATFRTREGGALPGADVIDPLWKQLAHWATVEQPRRVADQQHEIHRRRVLAHPEGARIWAEFERLADGGPRPRESGSGRRPQPPARLTVQPCFASSATSRSR
jgi:hypothetical protein